MEEKLDVRKEKVELQNLLQSLEHQLKETDLITSLEEAGQEKLKAAEKVEFQNILQDIEKQDFGT